MNNFIKYLSTYTLIHLLLSIIEIFFLSPIIDFLGNDIFRRIIVYSILFLLINPLFVYMLDRFIFKEEKYDEGV